MRRSDDINHSMDMSLRKLQEIVKDKEGWHAAVHGISKSGHDSTGTINVQKKVTVAI